jgi:conjugal transfer ATP-binding protein TraC
MIRKSKKKQSLMKKKDLKPKKKQTRGLEQKESVFRAATERDIAPSSIVEVSPGETRIDGQNKKIEANDYYVEIGSTHGGDARFIKTFYAVFAGTHTWDGMLTPLYAGEFGDGDIDVSIRIRPTETSKVLGEIARRIAGLESDMAITSNQQKIQAMRIEVEDLKRQQRRLRISEEKIFQVSVHTSASALTYPNMRRVSNAIVKKMSAMNIHLRSCDLFQLEALPHITPFARVPEKRFYKTLETSCVADLFPFGLGGLSHKDGIVLGYDQMGHPVLFDGWHPKFDGYNMVILGRTGSGKSFAIKLITLRSAVKGIRTAVIDPQREYRPMAEAMKCPFISLSPESPDAINIFDLEPQVDENGIETLSIEDTVRSVLPVIYRMIRSFDANAVTGMVKTKLQERLFELYRQFGFTDDIRSIYKGEKGLTVRPELKTMPTLSDYYEIVKKDPKLEEVSEYLKMFTRQGDSKYQSIFDIRHAPFFVFSLAALQDDEIMKPIGLYIATKWVWEKFGKKFPGTKKRIIVDEGHLLMGDQESADWIISAFKMGRKHNTSMCVVTQGFSDLARVPNGIAILQNSAVRMLFKQDHSDIRAVAEHFALSEGEKREVLASPVKGHAVLKAGSESTVVFVKAFPKEFELYNTDPNIPQEKNVTFG